MKREHLVDIISCTGDTTRRCLLFCLLALAMVLGLSSQAFSVDFLDYAQFASAWRTTLGEPDFNENYDFDDDNDVDITDLYFFTEDWLSPYPPQTNREKLSFNTGWKFYRGTASGSPEDPSYDDSEWQTVNLPHTPVISALRIGWHPGYKDINWYRKHFNLDPNYSGKKIFMEFEGADQIADVWINGEHLTTHYGSYLPFTVDITDYVNFGATENVIALKVDNMGDYNIPSYGLWVSSGGLYRDAWMYVTDKLHVTDAVDANIVAGGGIFVTFSNVSSSTATINVNTHVENEYASTKTCTVKTCILDSNDQVVNTTEMSSSQSIAAGSDHTFTQPTTVDDPCLWHPDHPYLYTVQTKVYDGNNIVDAYQTRIGIRSISFTYANGFEINGQTLRFRGANRVQDYPYLGWAMGNTGQRREVRLLREAGFQFIRTAHYPQDPAFLDACDEFGMLVMDEIPGFQYVGGDTYMERSYQNMRDMIRRDRNRPCVIAWELSLNESAFGETYANNAVDIGHAEYPGGYIAGWRLPNIYDVYIPSAGHVPSGRTYPGTTPLIIAEYGHWEYNYNGYSDVHRGYVSGGYYNYGETAMLNQILNHQDGLNQDQGLPISNMCGNSLWVGTDYGAWPSGVYDYLRLPKFSAYFFQSQRDPDLDLSYLGIDSGPMVFIANYWTASSPTDVKVFSNCDEVKLYKNDVLQDTRTPDTGPNDVDLQHPPFTFTGLTWESGELKAEGLIDSTVVATHIVNTPGSADSLLVEFSITEVPANGSESIFVYASILDSAGTVVTDASNEVTFSVSGEASLVSPATRDAEAGIATALIRVSDLPGLITVTATASGLTSDNASITSQ